MNRWISSCSTRDSDLFQKNARDDEDFIVVNVDVEASFVFLLLLGYTRLRSQRDMNIKTKSSISSCLFFLPTILKIIYTQVDYHVWKLRQKHRLQDVKVKAHRLAILPQTHTHTHNFHNIHIRSRNQFHSLCSKRQMVFLTQLCLSSHCAKSKLRQMQMVEMNPELIYTDHAFVVSIFPLSTIANFWSGSWLNLT